MDTISVYVGSFSWRVLQIWGSNKIRTEPNQVKNKDRQWTLA